MRNPKPSQSERRRRKLHKEIEEKCESLAADDDGGVGVQVEYVDPDVDFWVSIKGNPPAPQGVMDAIEVGIGHFADELGLDPKELWGYPTYPCPPEDESVTMIEWAKRAVTPYVIVTGNPGSGVVAKQRGISGLLDSMVLESSSKAKGKGFTIGESMVRKSKVDTDMDVGESSEMVELRAKVEALETKVAGLETKVSTMKVTEVDMQGWITGLQKTLAEVSPVMIEQLLCQCRKLCRNLLKQRRIRVASDWNDVLQAPACVAALEGAGLSVAGLQATACEGRGDGETVGEDSTLWRQYVAEVVCACNGARRAALLDVFRFVVGENAEKLAFERPSFFVELRLNEK